MNYIRRYYSHNDCDNREEIEVLEGSVWLLVIVGGGNGHDIVRLTAGESWREGWDELVGVYSSIEEAEAAQDKIYDII